MKAFSFSSFALWALCGASITLLVPGLASAGWVAQISGTTEHLYSVHFPVDAQTGYAVGDAGTIRKTTNGGANWVAQTSGTPRNFRSVHFPVNAQIGYAVGTSGAIRKTTDGGVSWVGQNSGTARLLSGVCFPLNDQTGYAVGDYGTILKTTDGGVGVEENAEGRGQKLEVRMTAKPNPFTSFAALPGHEAERFCLYDVSGRKVGTFRGDRVGEGLGPGVYFLRSSDGKDKPLRIVKVR